VAQTLQTTVKMIGRYLEDFAVGQAFGSGRIRIDVERIKSFAAEFDPQQFHLDEKAAHDSVYRELAASGWHTAALTMRLLVESELKPAGAGLWVPALTRSAGRGRYGPGMNCTWRVKCSKCVPRNRVRTWG